MKSLLSFFTTAYLNKLSPKSSILWKKKQKQKLYHSVNMTCSSCQVISKAKILHHRPCTKQGLSTFINSYNVAMKQQTEPTLGICESQSYWHFCITEASLPRSSPACRIGRVLTILLAWVIMKQMSLLPWSYIWLLLAFLHLFFSRTKLF